MTRGHALVRASIGGHSIHDDRAVLRGRPGPAPPALVARLLQERLEITRGRNARRTSEAPRRLGSIVWLYQDGSPARKWSCRSTSAPYCPASCASTTFTRS